jgi:hypothetical protein
MGPNESGTVAQLKAHRNERLSLSLTSKSRNAGEGMRRVAIGVAQAVAPPVSGVYIPAEEEVTIATKTKQSRGGSDKERLSDVRVTIRFGRDTLEALAAWARAEGRTTAAQGRYLLEQAVAARADRLALTRR